MRRRRRQVLPPLVLFALLPLAACDAAGPAPPAPPSLEATEELRIGSVDDPETMLTYVGAMDVRPDGRIYSVHRQDAAIFVHDSAGDRVAKIGREGAGPGEFQGLGAIGFLGDTLWAFDFRLHRASYFTPAGELVRTLNVPVRMRPDPESPSPPRPYGLLPDGRVFGSPPAFSYEIAAGTLTEVPAVAMDTAGGVLDTLYLREPTIWAIQDPTGAFSYASYREQPFGDEPLYAHSPREPAYVVVHRRVVDDASTTYRVARITFAGDTVFHHTLGYEPVPIDRAYPDSLVEHFATRVANSDFGNPPPLRQALEWARADLYVPAHYPPVETAVVGIDETTWLRLGGAGPGAEAVDWLVLDAGGEPAARVSLPRSFRLRAARRDRVWGWTADELDVPYIVQYGIGRQADD